MSKIQSEPVSIPAGGQELPGILAVPADPRGLVMFAHGSGSSRMSPRNRRVAETLNQAGFATVLFDLLSPPEQRLDAQSARLRFDIPLLAERLVAAVDWAAETAPVKGLRIGLYGSSTGAAAALVAAARRPRQVRVVVSRGGRTDLAGNELARVRIPCLFIVGGLDETVLGLNQVAARHMAHPASVVVVPGASHLFEEPGKLEEVGRLAVEWFAKHLGPERWLAGDHANAGDLTTSH